MRILANMGRFVVRGCLLVSCLLLVSLRGADNVYEWKSTVVSTALDNAGNWVGGVAPPQDPAAGDTSSLLFNNSNWRTPTVKIGDYSFRNITITGSQEYRLYSDPGLYWEVSESLDFESSTSSYFEGNLRATGDLAIRVSNASHGFYNGSGKVKDFQSYSLNFDIESGRTFWFGYDGSFLADAGSKIVLDGGGTLEIREGTFTNFSADFEVIQGTILTRYGNPFEGSYTSGNQSITIGAEGIFEIQAPDWHQTQQIKNLTFKGGSSTTTGTLKLPSSQNTTIQVNGTVSLVDTDSATHASRLAMKFKANAAGTTFDIAEIANNTETSDLIVSAEVSSGTINKTGLGTVSFTSTDNNNKAVVLNVNQGIVKFSSTNAMFNDGATATIEPKSGGTVAADGFAMNQTFVDKIVATSAGVIALGADSSNSLDLDTRNMADLSLGATGSFTYSGTLTSNSSTYRLGGGGGTLTVSSQLTGANALVVGTNGTSSASKVILTNTSNNYSSTTTINGGTLQLGAANVIPNGSNMILAGGTFASGGYSETVGTLTLTADSTLALGAGSHSLNFANSSGASWTGGTTLTITGWTGTAGSSGTAGKIYFGSGTGTLSAGQLAQISFAGYGTGALLLSDGELVPDVPIPEASTLGMAGLLCLFSLSRLGRRLFLRKKQNSEGKIGKNILKLYLLRRCATPTPQACLPKSLALPCQRY